MSRARGFYQAHLILFLSGCMGCIEPQTVENQWPDIEQRETSRRCKPTSFFLNLNNHHWPPRTCINTRHRQLRMVSTDTPARHMPLHYTRCTWNKLA